MKFDIAWKKTVVWLVIVTIGLTCGAGAMRWVRLRGEQNQAQAQATNSPASQVALAPGTDNTLTVPAETYETLGVRTVVVEPAPSPDPLRLSGSLIVDSSRLVHVHTRFGGEVVEIGEVEENGKKRPLRLNDKVTKGQLLAVIWSKEIGEKKSDLVDSLSQLWFDKAQLDRLNRLAEGVVTKKAILDAQRAYQKDIIDVDRMQRTLTSWRLTDEEINTVKREAERIRDGGALENNQADRTWAEVDVRAPFDGVVLEKNIAQGDIVDTDLDIFKIADLSQLAVIANIYEEDIPALEALPKDHHDWQITLKSQPDWPPIKGRYDLISNVIDPNQHTGTVMGWVDNRDSRLKVAQFITASIALPAPKDEVAVPVDAVIDEGDYSLVFVADDATGHKVTQRKVIVARHGSDHVFIRNVLTPAELGDGISRLEPGERVITNGNIELASALQDLRSAAMADRTAATRAP